ncbi:MAG: hypothetical protein KAR38_06685, partial [Calditrichia bacterium]|nr:hypothetical protein [Calditrichia bacterium]
MRKILLLILSLVFSVHLFAQPSFTSASYDEKTSVLTLNFDENDIIQNDNVILGGINIIPGGILNPIILDENSAVLPQDNSNSVNIVLYNNGNFSLKDKICDLYTNSIEGLKVKLNLATVIDVNNVENAESGLVNLTFNENSTPLKLTGAVFESEGNYLKLSFNDAITTESNNAGDIKIVNSSGDAISISQLKDNIMLNGDSSLWIQLNSTSLNAIHSAEFAGSDIQILKGAVKDQIWNSVADTLFNLTYIAPTFEVKAVSAIYREEKNRLEIDFNVDIQNEDWNESSVVSFRKIHLYTPADTVSILADPTFIQVIGETIRIKLQLGDQERIETTFNDTMDIKLLIEAGAVFSETTYVPCIGSDTVEVEYEMQDETKRFILDPENTYYSGGGHFLNVAFLGTSSALYNTIDKITDADDDEFANFRSIRIQFADKDTSISLPLGMLVPYDSVNTGLFRIPGNEARTLMLMNMDSATLKIKFDPFTFINKRDHGNAGAEFALNIMPASDAPNYESVVYETDSVEVIITFDKPINDEQYVTSGITFGGLAIGNIESTTLSVDQKTLRLKLETALTGLSKDPDVEIPAGAFTSIFGAPT